jgi:hypothetical protein
MSIFRDFFVKEKPVFTGIARGVGGFGFGTAPSTGGGAAGAAGITATGGIINEYESSGTYYKAHIFIEPGSFSITDVSGTGEVEYLVVGGGGGGATGGDYSTYQAGGGGGGAGGYRSNTPDTPTPLKEPSVVVSSGSYPVTIGQGGAGGMTSIFNWGYKGNDSTLGLPSPIVSAGGGGGKGGPTSTPTANGGSGGGGEGAYSPAGNVTNGTGTAGQGTDGGYGSTTSGPYANTTRRSAGGGGGAGGAGYSGAPQSPEDDEGRGGIGLNNSITGTQIGYAGGGTGGRYNGESAGTSPEPYKQTWGGGRGLYGPQQSNRDSTAVDYRGSGGGGVNGVNSSSLHDAGAGSPGTVVVRYVTSSLGGTAKATGGEISYVSNKAIHVFRTPGAFVAPSSIPGCNYLIVGGGGAGGNDSPSGNSSGGGGAGAVIYKSGVSLPGTSYSINIGRGGNTGTFGPQPDGLGEASTFNGLSAAGGGQGGTQGPSAGATGGGSGGGACYPNNSPGSASGSSGHPGGIDVASPNSGWGNNGGGWTPSGGSASGAGGGGAAAVGETVPGGSNVAGDGGNGARYTITGVTKYYGGGGGGHGFAQSGTGGQGGGGTGGAPYAITSRGINGTGGGGGGVSYPSTPLGSQGRPNAGGSGIVVISYPI